MTVKIDLHLHTNNSDGFLSSQDVIKRAADLEVKILSITDHDTVAAYSEALYTQARKYGVVLVPGVEISTVDSVGRRFHILGYGIDVTSKILTHELAKLRNARKVYAEQAIKKLQLYGWAVETAVLENTPVVTKAHIADSILCHKANKVLLERVFSKLPNRGEFIESMLNQGTPCYVRRHTIQPQEAVKLIHEAGGIAIFAHPVAAIYEQDLTFQDIERSVLKSGVDGIEALYYYYHKSGDDQEIDKIDNFVKISHRHQLLVSIGSDFHGAEKKLGAFTEIGLAGKTSWRQYEEDLEPLIDRLQATPTQ